MEYQEIVAKLAEFVPGAEVAWVAPSRFRGPRDIELHVIAHDLSKNFVVSTGILAGTTITLDHLERLATLVNEKLSAPVVG